MGTLIVQLMAIFAPIIRDIQEKHQAAHPGAPPLTDAQIEAEFAANVEKYLAEGSAWRLAHPDA